jgi:L-fucose mutarotase/ribose pyranase (RbsD/FucU family)
MRTVRKVHRFASRFIGSLSVWLLIQSHFPFIYIYTNRNRTNRKGNDIPTLLNAIMQLLPLDETAPPAMVMGMVSIPDYVSTCIFFVSLRFARTQTRAHFRCLVPPLLDA